MDYEGVTLERARDAQALNKANRTIGALYMFGYVVECRLKMLLLRRSQPFPAHGRAGHDLRALLAAAGFAVSDLTGKKRAFVEAWSTSMRYWSESPSDMDMQLLWDGAVELSGYVQRRVRNSRGKK